MDTRPDGEEAPDTPDPPGGDTGPDQGLQTSESDDGAWWSAESPRTLLPWAILVARVQLGLMFFMPGLWRVFDVGPLEHARQYFIEPYAGTGIPEWLLLAAGVTVPFVEQTAGALLLIGLFRRGALIALGLELCVITYGHLVLEPLFAFHTHVLPRLALLLFLMVVPLSKDRWALDALFRPRARPR